MNGALYMIEVVVVVVTEFEAATRGSGSALTSPSILQYPYCEVEEWLSVIQCLLTISYKMHLAKT
jgi:hypothetical protein